MSTPAIKIKALRKTFLTKEPTQGLLGAFKGLFTRASKEVEAIASLSFEVARGERIAFIGPNGAGKSTTIKMLTGILHPTSGHLEVLGLTPWKERRALGYQIGTVFGQRSQLWYHLAPLETFKLLASIYEIDSKTFESRLGELTKLFEIENLLTQPVRQLSLGERMRCEIVASVLHRPKVLFLDEPTIGLDINAKLMIRALLNQLSSEHGTTLFLTSHDTADIEQVCSRVIVLDEGRIINDSPLAELKQKYMKHKILTLTIDAEFFSLNIPGVQVIENKPYVWRGEIDVGKISIGQVVEKALEKVNIKDISIEDPSMEEVIGILYGKDI